MFSIFPVHLNHLQISLKMQILMQQVLGEA